MSPLYFFRKICIAGLFLLLSNAAVAQCDHLGIVQNSDDYCGSYLLDFTTGELLEITSADFSLPTGSVIAYSYENTGTPYNCGEWTVNPVSISCIEQIVAAEAVEGMCDFTDCIHPGDTDADLKANIYDLLNIGLGYGTIGIERPLATEDWEGQVGPDWSNYTVEGINYKHLDSNGDGFIDEADVNAISTNYVPEQQLDIPPYEEGTPELSVEFSVDSVFFESGGPTEIEVTATINLGTLDLPVEDLHGLAFMMKYPQDLVPPHSVNSEYQTESFLGNEQSVLWLEKDLYELGRNDVVVSRKSGSEITGGGGIFTTSFIIVVDIIVGRAENEIPFTVQLENIMAIDGEGNPKAINAAADATFIIVDNTTSATNDPVLAAKTTISPNPAQTQIQISTADLNTEEIEIFDTFGQLVLRQKAQFGQTTLDISTLPTGMYMVYVQTKEGVVVKKLVVK
ncbi:MAG: hypothetical protein ACI85O_000429 [Saprospiraceae bacterium]|jgi:hypothetical protein